MKIIIEALRTVSFLIGVLTMLVIGGDGVNMSLKQEMILKSKLLLGAVIIIGLLTVLANWLENKSKGGYLK